MYIAEPGQHINSAGRRDWNSGNPWNAPPSGCNQVLNDKGELKPVAEVSAWWSPEWGYNDWNRRDGPLQDSVWPISELPIGNGKQVVDILGFTRYYNNAAPIFSNETKNVINRVSYTKGGSDTPFSFNRKMTEQRLMKNSSLAPNPPLGTILSYAQGDEWKNYVYTLGGVNEQNRPYRPNMSSIAAYLYSNYPALYLDVSNLDVPQSYTNAENIRSTGIDCTALLQRAISYGGNAYSALTTNGLNDSRVDEYTSYSGASRLIGTSTASGFASGTTSWMIADLTERWREHPVNLDLAVPGDYIMLNGVNASHAAIILSIANTGNGNAITRNDIKLIHASQGKNRTWEVETNIRWQYGVEDTDTAYVGGEIGLAHHFRVRRIR